MIKSMTAFARVEVQESWGHVCWELRSVNHRYLEIYLRLPDEWRGLEIPIRERIQQTIKRGKIDGFLHFYPNTDAQIHINLPLVEQIATVLRTIDTVTQNPNPPQAIDILNFPGVLTGNAIALDTVNAAILAIFDQAMQQLTAHREREGTQLAALLHQRCHAISTEVEHVRQALPDILSGLRDKLHSRLLELKELNHDRIEQEIVMLAQKMDVAEELDRLDAHLQEIRQTLQQDQPIGRRLDFLVQELHREANTLGSKSNHLSTSRSAVEIKVLIEQMREQTQNIE